MLEWGWHASERVIDPFARHFRIYLAPPLDSVGCLLTSVAAVAGQPGVYRVGATAERPVDANAAMGQYLDAGYPFFIEEHSAGTAIQLTVSTKIPAPGGRIQTPQTGPTVLQLNYSDRFTRPGGWSERLLPVIPITSSERYQFVLRDRLALTEVHPRDALWIGVSAADDQAYVPDSVPARPRCPATKARWPASSARHGSSSSPTYDPPPPAAEAHRIVAPEPALGEVRFRLDFSAHTAGSGLSATEPVLVERLHGDDLLKHCGASGGALVGTFDGAAEPIVVSNPQDLATIVEHLDTGAFQTLPDRYLVLLAALHPFRDRLFRNVIERPIIGFAFDETLPATASRHVYRLLKANSAGQASPDGFVPPAVVRVPSMAPGPRPVKESPRATDPAVGLRFRVAAAEDLSHVLIFRAPASAPANGSLLRVPNRPDLHPSGHLRLVLDDGQVLVPAALAATELDEDDRGLTGFAVASDPPTGPERIWAVSTTHDGLPSALGGPWRMSAPYPASRCLILPRVPCPTSYGSAGRGRHRRPGTSWSSPPTTRGRGPGFRRPSPPAGRHSS